MNNTFIEVFKLMVQSFPEEEYREYTEQKKLLDIPIYSIVTKKDENNNLIGFISYWEIDNFIFIEHFAVNRSMRGKGIGSEMLKSVIKNLEKPIILEVEPPNDEISTKRIRFYKKLGFVLNDFKYYQMPLRKNCKPIEMYLMSYPNSLTLEGFEIVRNAIYKNVYSIN